MNIGELRRGLFHIKNQEMTIRELRTLLFQVNYQEEEILNENVLAELEKKYCI